MGLFWFLLLLFLSWRKAGQTRRRCKDDGRLQWAFDLSGMLQVSLVGYFATGIFLDVAYFDLLYVLIGLIVAMSSLVSRELIADADQAAGVKPGHLIRADANASD